MPIEQTAVIDFIGVDRTTGEVVLTITDSRDWHDSVREHLLLLQDKINSYLRFVESGELLDAYPEAKDRLVVISVVGRHLPNAEAMEFYGKARSAIEKAGFQLRFEQFALPDV